MNPGAGGDDVGALVTLRLLDLGDEALRAELVLGGHEPARRGDIKDRALARLGIARQGGEDHLAAWCRARAEEDGYPS